MPDLGAILILSSPFVLVLVLLVPEYLKLRQQRRTNARKLAEFNALIAQGKWLMGSSIDGVPSSSNDQKGGA